MSDYTLIEIVYLSARTLMLLLVPLLLALSLSSILIGVLQSATGIREQLLNYFSKLISLAVMAYLFMPAVTESIGEIFLICYR